MSVVQETAEHHPETEELVHLIVAIIFLGIYFGVVTYIAWIVVIEWRRYHNSCISKQGPFKIYLNYRFGHWYSWTSGSSAMTLCGLSATLLVVGGVLHSMAAATSISDSLWASWIWIAAPDGGGSARPGGYVVGMLVSVGGMLIFALLVSVISAGFEEQLQHIRQGCTPVLEGGHILILGWKLMTLDIVAELCTAEEGRGGRTIVIMGDIPKPDIEQCIQENQIDTKGSNIVVRSGDPRSKDDLERVAAASAKTILVLAAADISREEADSRTLNCLLTLYSQGWPAYENAVLVVECCLVRNQRLFQSLAVTDTEVIAVQDFVGELMVESSQQRGLCRLLNELVGFEGDELYIAKVDGVQGKTFRELLFAFEEAVPVGMFPHGQGSDVKMLPDMDYMFTGQEELVLLAEDATVLPTEVHPTREQLAYFSQRLIQNTTRGKRGSIAVKDPEKELVVVIGWNEAIGAMITEIDALVTSDSEVLVFSPHSVSQREEFLTAAQKRSGWTYRNVTVSHWQGSIGARYMLEELPLEKAARIFILADNSARSAFEADGLTVAAILQVRDILLERQEAVRPGQVIMPQLLGESVQGAIEQCGLVDYIDSNRLSARILASVCETPRLSSVFQAILSEAGVRLYLRNPDTYKHILRKNEDCTFLHPEHLEDVSFAEITSAAAAFGEIALGWSVPPSSPNVDSGMTSSSNDVPSVLKPKSPKSIKCPRTWGGEEAPIRNKIRLNPKTKDEKCALSPDVQIAVLAPSKGSTARLWHRKGLARRIRMKTAFVKKVSEPDIDITRGMRSMTSPSLPLFEGEDMMGSEGSDMVASMTFERLTSGEREPLVSGEQSMTLQAADPVPTSTEDVVRARFDGLKSILDYKLFLDCCSSSRTK